MRALLGILLTVCVSVSEVSCSPIIIPQQPGFFAPAIRKDFCFLPPEYGASGGNVTFLEDCPLRNLKRYDTLPKIADQYRRQGVHPRVCCPEYLSPYSICTPSDAWCPTYEVSQHR